MHLSIDIQWASDLSHFRGSLTCQLPHPVTKCKFRYRDCDEVQCRTNEAKTCQPVRVGMETLAVVTFAQPVTNVALEWVWRTGGYGIQTHANGLFTYDSVVSWLPCLDWHDRVRKPTHQFTYDFKLSVPASYHAVVSVGFFGGAHSDGLLNILVAGLHGTLE